MGSNPTQGSFKKEKAVLHVGVYINFALLGLSCTTLPLLCTLRYTFTDTILHTQYSATMPMHTEEVE